MRKPKKSAAGPAGLGSLPPAAAIEEYRIRLADRKRLDYSATLSWCSASSNGRSIETYPAPCTLSRSSS